MLHPARHIIERRREEKRLIKTIARHFAETGYVVFMNVQLLDTEIDIVAIKECRDRFVVKIVEVKSLPKQRLIKQVHARACIAHHVYAGLPAQYRDWAERKLPKWCGIILVRNNDKVEIVRRAQMINRDSTAPIYFAKLLLSYGNFMSSRVYGPAGQSENMKILTRLRTFLSSFSSNSSTSQDSDSVTYPYSDQDAKILVKVHVFTILPTT